MSREGIAPKEQKSDPPAPDAHASLQSVTRWLKGLTVLALGSWILLALLLLPRDRLGLKNVGTRDSSAQGASADQTPGPWGKIDYVPIGISPPVEMLPPAGEIPKRIEWHFPDVLITEFSAMLSEIGISEGLREKLVEMAEINPSNGGFIVEPSREMILGLSPEDRTALYVTLAGYPGNFDQRNGFRFRGASLDEWLDGSSLSAETRALVEPLVYRKGQFLFFSDLRAIEPSLTPSAKQSLVKALSREATFLMRVEITSDTDIDELVDYWGRAGRARDVRPILESARRVADSHGIDVMHLLPPFARQRLYTYDVFTSEKNYSNRDCHWSAMNFFAEQPDDRFLDLDEVMLALAYDYYHIYGNLQLGDVIIYLDSDGNLIHSAVYIADDVVFTKNGNGSAHPWMLMRLDDMLEFYPRTKELGVRYYRRKDL